MIAFRCTQKMFKELRISRSGLTEPEEGFLGSWFVNVFRIGRRKCVFFMNDQTLYSVVLYGMKKNDFDNIGRRFVAGLTANLQQDGFPAEVVASVGMTCHPVVFGKTNSRSVLGSQNDLIHLGKIWADGWEMETEEGILGLNH